jgi:hypothetical protein
MNLGYLIISSNVVRLLTAKVEFARWFGECLQSHLIKIKSQNAFYGTQLKSEFGKEKTQIGFVTEFDKNGMPRTAAVFPTDGAY